MKRWVTLLVRRAGEVREIGTVELTDAFRALCKRRKLSWTTSGQDSLGNEVWTFN